MMLLVGLVLVITLLWFLAKPFYWRGKGIKYLVPWPVVGNLGAVFTGGVKEIGRILHNAYPDERLFGFHSFFTPGLVIRDPNLMVEMAVTNADHFLSNGLESNQDYDLTGGNLLFLKGQQWKEVRAKLSPSFTPAKVKTMISSSVDLTMPKVETILDNLVEIGEPCNHSRLLLQIVNNVITHSVFGVESDCFEENSLFLPLADVFFSQKTTLMLNIKTASPALFKLLRLQSIDTDGAMFVKKTLKDLIEYRKKNGTKGHDFVQGIVDIMDKHEVKGDGSKKVEYFPDGSRVPKYDFDEMFLQALIIFLGGVESTATTMTWLFYEIAKNQEIQQKCRDEVAAVAKEKGRKITLEDSNDLVYLNGVVKEAVRMYPAFPVLSRICDKEYKLKDYDLTIKPGQMILFATESFQRDAKYYPDPDTFKPERYASEDTQPGFISTFGIGPRTCLGKSFAVAEMVLVVGRLLHKYKFSLHPKTQTPLVAHKRRPINAPLTPLWLEVTRA